MEDSRNIIKAIDALTLKAGGEAVDSKNITEAIDHLKEVYDQEAIEIDDTLTQEGLAADAKAVGTGIASLQTKLGVFATVKRGTIGQNSNYVFTSKIRSAYLIVSSGQALNTASVWVVLTGGTNGIIVKVASWSELLFDVSISGLEVTLQNSNSVQPVVYSIYLLNDSY